MTQPAAVRRRIAFDMRWAIALLAVSLEALWAYPWFGWLSHWNVLALPGPSVSLASAFLLAAGAMVVARLVLESSARLGRARLLAIALLALWLALVVRLETGGGYALWDTAWGSGYAVHHLSETMSALALGIYLLWRGISVAREGQTFDEVYLRFIIGLVALVALGVAWRIPIGASGAGSSVASVGAYALAYFACGLLALALVNLQTIREEMVRQEGGSGLFSRRWLSLLMVVVLGIVLLGVGIASGLSLDLAALVLRPLALAGHWLLIALVYAIGYPLGFIAAGLVYAFQFLLSHLRGTQPPQQLQAPDMGDISRQLTGGEGATLTPWVVVALKVGAILLVVAIIATLLALALFRRRKSPPGEEVVEVSESLFTWTAFRADLGSFLRWLLSRFRRRRQAPQPTPVPPVAVTQVDDDGRTLSVRELYQGLLWEGAEAGAPRGEHETPFEYEARLAGRLPDARPDLGELTEAYVCERYGEAPTPQARLGPLNRLWRRLRAAFRPPPAS